MIVHGNGQGHLRPVLPDHIFVKLLLNLLRLRKHFYLTLTVFLRSFVGKVFPVLQKRNAELHAFVANIDSRAGNQAFHFTLGLFAERTAALPSPDFVVT